MSASNDPSKRRHANKTLQTRSGKTIRLHQSLSDRLRANRLAREKRRAVYLSTLPKNPYLRALYRLHPKRIAAFWFSTDGALMALKIVGVGIVAIFLLTIGVFAYFRKDLPKIKDISGDNLGGSITYYDSTGKTVLWQDYDAVKRIPVATDQISPYIKQATVAIEDKNFYHEGAFNPTAIVRAGLHDVVHSGGSLQGASTITQQLVKLNEQWTDNRTITRKIKELILAVELSREYSKDDILTGYLNIAPYGGVEYGVEAAARDYFGTDASHLTLAQAAMLAAIPQDPPYFSPYSSPAYNKDVSADYFGKDALIARQHYILDQMVDQKMITKAQAEDAKKVDILAQVHPLSSKYNGIKAPWFVLAAKQELQQKYGSQLVQRGGWQVTTTLNMDLQNKAEELVSSNYSNIQRRTGGKADEEAMVAEDVQTGQIVALVGGTDFNNADHGQNNYAAGILIPPGSSFKPYDYSAFIDGSKNGGTGVGAGSVLYDQEGPIPGYPCTSSSNCLHDYDFYSPGPVTLRYALGGSRNIPAVKAMMSSIPNDSSAGYVASINQTIKVASAMMDNPYIDTTYNCYADEALTRTTQCYGASAIGDGAYLYLDDHVNGLSTLARLGVAIPRSYILKITDSTGKAIFTWQQPQGKQVIAKDTAYIVDSMASDPRASYLAGSCNDNNCTGGVGVKFHRYNGWHFAIKTGTTNNGFDGLMTSWSTKYAVVTWVGNHRRNVNLNTFMEQLTGPLASGFMQYAHRNLPANNWQQPSDIKVLPSFVVNKRVSARTFEVVPGPSTDLFPSWYTGTSSTSSSQTIDKVTGKTATSCTPDAAKQTQTGGSAVGFSADKFVGSASTAAAAGTDDVHHCDDLPPSVTLTIPDTCDASDNSNQGCQITFTATQGTHLLTDEQYPQFPGTVTIAINGTTVKTFNVSDSPSSGSFYYQPTSTASGVKVTATVSDSVLYQSSDSKTMDTVAASGP
jgi:penicillin-binding protein 1A